MGTLLIEMKLSSSQNEASRSNSVTAMFASLAKPRNKSTLSVVTRTEDIGHGWTWNESPGIMTSKKSKRNAFADFFRGWGNSRAANKARYQASRLMRPPSPRPKTQMKSFDIDEALLERVMGKPKDAKPASSNFIVQQKIRARSRSRTRSPKGIESRGDGDDERRGRARPLTTKEAQSMFAGAPYFNVGRTKSGHQPQVVFVDENARLYSETSTDYIPVSHPSFEACTLAIEEAKGEPKSILTSSRTALQETPSMYSAASLEPGTTSFEHFLQLGIADDTTCKGSPTLASRDATTDDQEEVTLRGWNKSANLRRLSELSAIHTALKDKATALTFRNEHTISKMGEQLFSKTLIPPAGAKKETASLRTQIEALQKILNAHGSWYDLSRLDSQLRVGQLLWSAPRSRKAGVKSAQPEPIVLVQIALAAELLIRTRIAKTLLSDPDQAPLLFTEQDRIAIESQRTSKVDWNLVLAERFLENVNIVTHRDDAGRKPHTSSFSPKYEARQASGLTRFAEGFHWPVTDSIGKKEDRGAQEQKIDDAPDNAVSSILSMYSNDQPDESGWLSRAWSYGVVMPGYMASHCLMGALLESTPSGLGIRGQDDLRNGFVYGERSYWSKQCTVGRVLAAAADARECMGWISIPLASVPLPRSERWIHINVSKPPHTNTSAPRIQDADAVGRDSDPLGHGEATSLQKDDFTYPDDGLPVMGNEVRLENLSLAPIQEEDDSPFKASLSFASPINNKIPSMDISLDHDVHFVTSYPCQPAQRKPRAPRVQDPEEWYGECMPSDFLGDSDPSNNKDDTHTLSHEAACHALHNDYRFEIIPVATLLSAPPEERPLAFSMPDIHADEQGKPAREVVVVLDCRGKSDLQLFARSWCAKVGEHAIVAKIGRTCLACSIREAKALDISVVIRI